MPLAKPVLLRLPIDLEAWLKDEAKRDERSFNAFCRRILATYRDGHTVASSQHSDKTATPLHTDTRSNA